jgi:hypothetical protein
MNGKERILAALAGEQTDRVPFAPNIWQWYHANAYNDTLPPEAAGLADPVAVLRALGADVLSKFDSPRPQPINRSCAYSFEYEGSLPRGKVPWSSFGDTFGGGPVRNERIQTAHGTLTHTWEYRAETGAPFETVHWWKDFDAEYPAVRDWLTNSEWHVDTAALAAGLANVGQDGTIIFQLLPSPLKQFHWLAGQVNASYFITDHPQEMQELAEIYAERSLAYVEEVAGLPDVWIYEVADNLDSLFYPPRWFRQFCVPVLRRAAAILHARGKYLFVHACGKLKKLAPLYLEAELDCVEGQAPPPIGDWPLHEARALSPNLIVCGGMAAPQQELAGPEAADRIDAYVRQLFESMDDKRRFIFASSCNTSPRTPYANLLAFRDAAWKYGRL